MSTTMLADPRTLAPRDCGSRQGLLSSTIIIGGDIVNNENATARGARHAG